MDNKDKCETAAKFYASMEEVVIRNQAKQLTDQRFYNDLCCGDPSDCTCK